MNNFKVSVVKEIVIFLVMLMTLTKTIIQHKTEDVNLILLLFLK